MGAAVRCAARWGLTMSGRSRFKVGNENKQQLEAILNEADKKGWRARKDGQYWNLYCPCGEHKKTVRLTPGKYYWKKLRTFLSNHTCWDNEPEETP